MQITLGALALVSSVALALRVLRRGEREVLEEELPPMDVGGMDERD